MLDQSILKVNMGYFKLNNLINPLLEHCVLGMYTTQIGSFIIRLTVLKQASFPS